MNKNYPLMALLLIIGLAAGFFAGTKYQQSKMPAGFRAFQNGNGNRLFVQGGSGNGNSQMRLRQGGGLVTGEILSADDKSITVKLPDGSSKIVLMTGTTSINKASEGSRADLKVGEKVTVMGNANSDGSVSAQNIQLGTANFFRGGPVTGTPSTRQ